MSDTMENDTDINSSYNTTTALQEETFLHDAIVTSIWSLLVLYGLASNILIIWGISRNRTMKNSTSYWLIIHLAICDILMLVVTSAHILPATLLHDRFVTKFERRNSIAMFFYDTFWYTGVLGLGGMAINRLLSIISPPTYSRWFSKANTVVCIAVLCLGGTVASIPALFDCCLTVYDHFGYVTTLADLHSPYIYFDLVLNSICLLVMFVCYAVIILKVRKSRLALERHRKGLASPQMSSASTNGVANSGGRQAQKASRRDIRLFIQFCVVSLVFLATFVFWQILPRLVESKWIYAVMTGLFLVNNGTNPTVYIIFNSTLRKEIIGIIRPNQTPPISEESNSIVRDGPGPNRILELKQKRAATPATTNSTPIEPKSEASERDRLLMSNDNYQ